MRQERLLSLDAFRGFTIAAMLLVNNPGDWAHLYGPLAHARWHDWTFTDWIFPFFVFISGISMTLSLTRRATAGAARPALLAQTLRRGAIIIAIGLALNFIPAFSFETLRWPGVLQRLGLCTMLTAPIALWLSWRAQLGWLLGLLALYSVILLGVPVPGPDGIWRTGVLEPGLEPGAWLDRALMDGHLWSHSKTWDPEGLLSTLPAVASQIAGLLVGHWLASHRAPGEKAIWLMVSGLACLWAGELLGAWLMPINKSLWTPSYVFSTAGWAQLLFACCYWLLDAMPLPLARARMARLTQPLVVFGMNALFIFALSGLVAKLLYSWKLTGPDGATQSLKAWLYAPIQALPVSAENASLLFALAFVAAMYGIAWLMWRRRWFLKV